MATGRGVKFLCDKCKTRYSIGDDRVRGKILKIRCKNCANIITVREGMDISPSEPRRNPTMAIQKVDIAELGLVAPGERPAQPHGALGAAFAQQMTKPPPALEEEWYVSMDGNQEGPFSLAVAQRWVSTKPFDAELHCWSEGFDDWLPVDKVSHFRNLRKRPPEPTRRPPTMPPPIPAPPEKPLFAATMASIEKAASGPMPATKPLPSITGSPTLKGQAMAGMPMATKANGTGVAHAMQPMFKPDEQMTAVEAPAFDDELATTAEPVAASRRALPMPLSRPVMPAAATPVPVKPIMDDEEDNLEIGEVSRVVKLADLAAMQPSKKTASNPALRVGTGTASNPSLQQIRNSTASMQKLSPSELGMNVDAVPGAPLPDESIMAQSFRQRHRRGLYMLLGVSAMMVAGVVIAVAFFVSKGDSDLPVTLGGSRVIDTSRPEDIVRRQLPPPPNATGSATTHKNPRPYRPGQITTTEPDLPETGPTSKLDAGEVEAMASKYGEGTKRCYMRAQKGALGFEIADTKKIDVTLTVAKDGSVSDVQLSKHANNEFGQCLIARIKGWHFRESRGGTFRIALAFSAG